MGDDSSAVLKFRRFTVMVQHAELCSSVLQLHTGSCSSVRQLHTGSCSSVRQRLKGTDKSLQFSSEVFGDNSQLLGLAKLENFLPT